MRRLTAILVGVLALLSVAPTGDVDGLKRVGWGARGETESGTVGSIVDKLLPQPVLAVSGGLAHQGRPPSSSVRDRLVGVWKLIAIERRRDGELLSVEREFDKGFLFYTSSGHMSVQIMRPDREKVMAAQPSEEKAESIIESYLAYFGTFTVNEAEGTVTHHKEGDLYPGRNPHSVRSYQFSGNRLSLVPLEAEKTVTTVIWERVE